MKRKVGLLIGKRTYLLKYFQWFLNKNDIYDITNIFTQNDEYYIEHIGEHIKTYLTNNIEDVINSSDIVFSFSYWKILQAELINKVPLGIVNIHHSYALQYKGRYTCTYAIQNGDKFFGSTIHYIDANLDEGQIIDSVKIPISEDDTAYTLMQKSNELCLKLLDNNLTKILDNNVKPFIVEENINYEKHFTVNHDIDISKYISEGKLDKLHTIVRSLTYPNKPKPYFISNGVKIYMNL